MNLKIQDGGEPAGAPGSTQWRNDMIRREHGTALPVETAVSV
jgi:hypothetical protein